MMPHDRRRSIGLQSGKAFKIFVFVLFAALSSVSAQAQIGAPPLDVPYVPTPQPVVEKMLEMANVGKDDVIFDLGSGDGRLVITAAKQHGAKGIGIDLDPQRVAEANANARRAHVEKKVEFIVGDLFKADFSEATVVTLYLLPRLNLQLRPQLWRQLKIGTRVVSHGFDMGPEWPPQKTEKYHGSFIYYWTITEEQKKGIR